MGCRPESAAYGHRPNLTGALPLSSLAGKLSDHPASFTGRSLFLDRLDHGDEIISVICRALQPLRRNLSRARVDHHFADLDVSHLFVPAARRQIKRDPAPGTRKARQISNVGVGDAAGVMKF